MTLKRAHTLNVFVLLAAVGISHAAEVAWPEAVSRLAGERYKAQTCVALLKGTKNDAQVARGRLAYATAKADSDAVIAGLLTTLALDQQPVSLPGLEAKLQSSTVALAQFCRSVSELLPDTAGQKSVVVDIVKAAIEPVIKALSDGVAALYTNHRQDDALTRGTIRTQLEAARWPDFAEVQPAQ